MLLELQLRNGGEKKEEIRGLRLDSEMMPGKDGGGGEEKRKKEVPRRR